MQTSSTVSDTTTAERPQVLVVDDDAEIVMLLSRYLSGHGFRVVGAASGAQLRTCIRAGSIDLVLLDLGLPDEDGLSLLRYLQENWRGPVIVVSGRGEPVERVVGLELGADDYVAKPFDFRELLARIRSVLRRAPSRQEGMPVMIHRLAFGDLTLDLSARRLTDRLEREIPLTTGEFDLLKTFLEHPGQVLTRDQLMSSIHGREAGPFDRAIDVQIGRLRRKIDIDPAMPPLIKSVRGVGYLLTVDVRRSGT